MGKKRDYTKFSSNKPEPKVEPVEAVVEPVVEEQVEEVEEIVKTDPVGIVVDCLKLNIRVAPNAKASIAGVVDASANLVISEDESTEDFYKVCTASGLEGYCMKRFVKIHP